MNKCLQTLNDHPSHEMQRAVHQFKSWLHLNIKWSSRWPTWRNTCNLFSGKVTYCIQPQLAEIVSSKRNSYKHLLLSFWLIAVNESSGLTATWWIGAPNRGRNCFSCVFHCQRTNTPSSPTESRLEPLKMKNDKCTWPNSVVAITKVL